MPQRSACVICQQRLKLELQAFAWRKHHGRLTPMGMLSSLSFSPALSMRLFTSATASSRSASACR